MWRVTWNDPIDGKCVESLSDEELRKLYPKSVLVDYMLKVKNQGLEKLEIVWDFPAVSTFEPLSDEETPE